MLEETTVQKMSPLGRSIYELKEEILEKWIKIVKTSNQRADKLREPILVNTLPALLENLAEAVSPIFTLRGIEAAKTVADEHGGERARLTTYSPSDIIQEYQALREAIFQILTENNFVFTLQDREGVNTVIDGIVRRSVTSFELIQFQIREQFIATLTHDLRNPISAANMAAELVTKEMANPTEVESLVQIIRDNLKRANGMIQDLLNATMVSSGERMNLELHPTNMLEIVQKVVQEKQLTHSCSLKIKGNAINGYWDGGALMRAIENVVMNAIKYGDSTRPMTISLSETHGRAIVAVHNFGAAIPVDEQEGIFQIFRRAKQAKLGKKSGWGLGLALVRGVAESHGGSVAVTSTEQDGTTFIIDIPVDARPFQDAPSAY